MSVRKVSQVVEGTPAVDGAGVPLTRVLDGTTIEAFDPFLMLDSFDSTNPDDYIAGFPTHPHRGIETVTYLEQGWMDHEDSLGNKGSILPGSAQWMTAGSGIMHSEFPRPAGRMLGLQFWLNLPAAEKMDEPRYFDITAESVPVVAVDGGQIRVIAGRYGDVQGAKPYHIQATFYDIRLDAGAALSFPVAEMDNAFLFLLEYGLVVDGQTYNEKDALLLSDQTGDTITFSARPDEEAHVIFAAGQPVREPVAWGGPIVMNTRAELNTAFQELRNGTFIKAEAAGI